LAMVFGRFTEHGIFEQRGSFQLDLFPGKYFGRESINI
jgi:hypothetical protein